MTEDFELFKAWIHAIIEEKINDALGKDSLSESMIADQIEMELIRVITEKNDHH